MPISKKEDRSRRDSDHTKQKPPAMPILKGAPPPWHAQMIVYGLLAIFALYTPASIASMDEIATVEMFTRTLFPTIFSIDQLIFCRIVLGIALSFVCYYDFLFYRFDFPVVYYEGSKLKPTKLYFRGLLAKGGSFRTALMCNTSFTNWSVGLLGHSFLLNGLIPFLALHLQWDVPLYLLRLAVLLWTMAAPSALLVSLVVKYALWPEALAQGGSTEVFKEPLVLVSHNLNSIAALAEAGILGGLPCRFQDFAAAPVFGLIYILNSWCLTNLWSKDFTKEGPQFLYPFFDTTLPMTCSIAIVALFIVFIVSFGLFSLAEYFLTEYVGGGVMGHAIAVSLLCTCVCRFRD